MAATDIAGVVLSGSGAAVVAVLGKFMLAVVLGAIALGFFLRLVNRKRAHNLAPRSVPLWNHCVSAVLTSLEVGTLIEATNFPIRFDQAGFELWHWALIIVALVVVYWLNLQLIGRFSRKNCTVAKT